MSKYLRIESKNNRFLAIFKRIRNDFVAYSNNNTHRNVFDYQGRCYKMNAGSFSTACIHFD